MDYGGYIKKLSLPKNVSVPTKLRHDNLTARPLTRADLNDDLIAVNSSIEVIRKTRGGSWPEDSLSEDIDFLDLAWHEREFREGSSFAYVVYESKGAYIGCFYLYGIGIRTELTTELSSYEVDVSWWVTADAYNLGYYKKLQDALRSWLCNDFKFTKVYYSNSEV